LALPLGLSCAEEGLVKPFIPDAVEVQAPRETLRPGEVMVLRARLSSTDVALVTDKVSWSSTNPAVATVDSVGLVTAVSRGQAVLGASVVTADGRTLRGTTVLTVVGVQAVTVEGAPATLVLGTGVQLAARLTLDAGAASPPVTWASSNPAAVSVSSAGYVTGVAIGTATISATAERAVGTAVLRVISNVAQVRLAPLAATLVVAQTQQFTATLTDAAGNVLAGHTLGWSSSNGTVATVSASGNVTAVAPGATTITVTEPSTGRTATAAVTVVPRITSAVITPANPAVFQGQSLQLTAVFRDSTGAIQVRPTIWQVSAPQVATVGRSTGLVTAVAPGTTTVVAIDSLSGQAANTTVTVVAPVASVSVSPSTSLLAIGATAQLTASAFDAAGAPLTGRPVVWSSSNATVATVSATGLVTAVTAGTATITASVDGRLGSATVLVNPTPVASVQVAPAGVSLVVNAVQQFTASAFAADGAVLTGRPVTWSSTNAAVATVSADGLMTGIAPGSATVVATVEGRTATAAVVVTAPPVSTVTVSPATVSVSTGGTRALTATLRDVAGVVLPGREVAWSSSAPNLATVSATGVVTGMAVGTATITASAEGRSGTATVRVTSSVAQIRVAPAAPTMVVEQTVQLAAVLTDSSGTVLGGQTVEWGSSTPTVASVSAAGLVTAVAVGTATVTVTEVTTGRSASAVVTVVPRVASASISPANPSVFQGQAVQLSAAFFDANGGLLTRPTIWQVSAPQVATVGRSTGLVTAVAPGTATVVAANTTVTVVAPVAALTVSPPTSTLAIGGTVQLIASAFDGGGAPLTGRPVTWSSSNATVASVSATGLVTAVSAGTATLTASVEGKTATATVLVNPPPVASVQVAPATANLVVNAVRQFTASAFAADGTVLTGRSVTWSSTNAAVLTVSATGLATGVAPGSATVVATVEGRTATASVVVTAPPVNTVTVSPATGTVSVGTTQALTATLRDVAGVVLPGREVTWTSSAPTVATVSASGVVTGVTIGTAIITASAEGRTGTAEVRVTSSVAQIRIAPAAPTMVVEQTLQLSAVLTDASGNVVGGQTVEWGSSTPAVASVSAAGLVTAVAIGTTTITVTEVTTGRSASAVVTVVPRVASASISPANPSVFQGQAVQLSVAFLDANGGLLSRPTIWQVSAPQVATVGRSTGLVTAVAPGTATVVAIDSLSGQAANTTVTVVAPVATVSVSPSSSTLAIGGTVQLIASAFDGGGAPLTGRPVTWSSSNATVATVSATGLVTAVSAGTATLTASVEGRTGSATVTVNPPPVATVQVAPATASLVVNAVQQFTASAFGVDGAVLTGRPVAWSSTNVSVLTISATGLATGVSPGSATVVATVEGRTATAAVVVTAPPVSTVSVTPATATVITGATLPLTATLRDVAGVVLPGRDVSWASSAPAVATVSAAGVVTGVSVGSATITATAEGRSSTSAITVINPPVAAVAVDPPSAAMLPTDQVSLTARVTDASGNVLAGRVVTWTSSNAAVATVNGSGRVTAVSPGSATISATAEGRSGGSTITVNAPVATVTVSPATVALLVGAVQQLSATSRDSAGNTLQRRPVDWNSSNPSAATVSAQGLVSGVAPGVATITASVEGRTANAQVTVALAPVATLTLEPSGGYMPVGVGVPLVATVRDGSGNVLSGRPVVWASSDEQRGTVSSGGVVTAATTTPFTVTATSEGRSAAATFEGRTGLRSGDEQVFSNPTAGSWTYFAVHVPAGSTSLTVALSGGAGDPDLFVWRPGNTGTASCYPELNGPAERCDFLNANVVPGVWLIGVKAYAAHSQTRLVATVRP
jgi:uncharacterized protein YjdB